MMTPSSENALARCARSVVRLPVEVCTAAFKARAPIESDDALRDRQRMTIWRLLDAYQRAANGPLTLPEILARVGATIGGARDTFVLWVDAIESIVQEVERLYGPQPGLGAYKAAQVKAAVLHAMRMVPRKEVAESTLGMTQSGLEVIASWVIDGVVLTLNRRELWQLSGASKIQLMRWFQLRTRVAMCMLSVARTVERWVARDAELLPQVRVIAENTAKQFGGDLLGRTQDVFEFFIWSVEHRQQFIGLVDLVMTATQEAEAFTGMSGSEKQSYARELILLALQEGSQVVPSGPLWDSLARSVIDVAIDAVVRIFNKRGLFVSRSATGELPREAMAGSAPVAQ